MSLQPPPFQDDMRTLPRAEQDFLLHQQTIVTVNAPGDAHYVLGGGTNADLPNSEALGNLATGIVKVTTLTGLLTTAVAGDFPTLNQTTTGSAATLTTPRTINGVAFDGSASIMPFPTVRASGRATAQTAAIASLSTYTLAGVDGSFSVSANVNVTTSTLHNFTVTCTYTDETNASRTLTLGFTQLSGATLLTAITNGTGAGPYESVTYPLRCKASTAITIATTGTFTTVTYNAEGIITQVA